MGLGYCRGILMIFAVLASWSSPVWARTGLSLPASSVSSARPLYYSLLAVTGLDPSQVGAGTGPWAQEDSQGEALWIHLKMKPDGQFDGLLFNSDNGNNANNVWWRNTDDQGQPLNVASAASLTQGNTFNFVSPKQKISFMSARFLNFNGGATAPERVQPDGSHNFNFDPQKGGMLEITPSHMSPCYFQLTTENGQWKLLQWNWTAGSPASRTRRAIPGHWSQVKDSSGKPVSVDKLTVSLSSWNPFGSSASWGQLSDYEKKFRPLTDLIPSPPLIPPSALTERNNQGFDGADKTPPTATGERVGGTTQSTAPGALH